MAVEAVPTTTQQALTAGLAVAVEHSVVAPLAAQARLGKGSLAAHLALRHHSRQLVVVVLAL